MADMTDPTTSKLLIALLCLVVVALLATTAFLYLRYRRRQAARQSLPQYVDIRPQSAISHNNTRPGSDYLEQEKQDFYSTSDSPPPSSPIPEIRITLPEDIDAEGKSQDGRVVRVHVGETTVGFEPYNEKRAHYQTSESDRFESLDLQRIGGLKEKEYS